MNAVVSYDPSVPAFLRNAGFLALNNKAAAGLSLGAPTRISFRGSRFRFVAADGTETALPDTGPAGNNSLSLDVIVVDASDTVSKFYYSKAYDPNADDLSPTCFSDNGVGPSNRANTPQSLLCGNCPNSVWGSKVTPQGSKVKACSDVKKIAVVPISNINGPVYMLGIPAASLKTWSAAVNAVTQRGIPIPALVVRLGFEPGAEYPKLTFSPIGYINEDQAASIQDLFGSDECNTLVGRNDVPIQSLPGATAPVNVQAPAAAPTPFVAPPAPATPAFLQQPPPAHVQQAAPAPQADAALRRRGRPAGNGAAPAQAAPAPVATAAPANINALLDSVLGPAK